MAEDQPLPQVTTQPPAEPTPRNHKKHSKIDQMMKKWKDILQDDSVDNLYSESPTEPPDVFDRDRRQTIEYFTLSSGSLINGEFLPFTSNISIGSIECQAITLDSDFHSIPKREYAQKNQKATSSSPLAKSEQKLVKYTKYVTKYYDSLWKQFGEVESILRLPNVPAEQQQNINLISAQLWFATYLQAREFNCNYELASDPYQLHFLGHHFNTISKLTKTLVAMHSLLRESLISFDTVGKKYIREMKILLTGNSLTDLMRINELTPYDDLLQAPDLWIMNNYNQIQNTALLKANKDNKNQKPINLGRIIAEHRQLIKSEHKNHPKLHNPIPRKSKSLIQLKESLRNFSGQNKQSDLYTLNPFNQIVHDFRDSLAERRNMDIFMKNITKSGWMDYDATFPNNQKIHLIRELINHTIIGFQKLMKLVPKLMKQLKQGNNPISCCSFIRPTNTFLPWIEQSSKIIHYCGQHKNWIKPGDFERLRFNVLANEVQLNTLIGKGKQIQGHLHNIIKIINVCSNLLYHQHNIKISKYDYTHDLMTTELGIPGSLDSEDEYDDEEFYLCEYSQTLKHVPLYFHITEFILSKRLPLEETKVFGTHSDIKFF